MKKTKCRIMGRLSVEKRSKVIVMWRNGYPVSVIKDKLSQEGVVVSNVSLFALIKKYRTISLVIDLPRKHRSSKLAECHYRYIDDVMTEDNKLTSRQLFALFGTKYPDVQVSISTIKRARKQKSKKTRYCALIREANKEKRLEWL